MLQPRDGQEPTPAAAHLLLSQRGGRGGGQCGVQLAAHRQQHGGLLQRAAGARGLPGIPGLRGRRAVHTGKASLFLHACMPDFHWHPN